MKHVWILSEGEKGYDERVTSVFSNYDAAIAALRTLAEEAGCDIKVSWAAASFEDDVYYTIIREWEVTQ